MTDNIIPFGKDAGLQERALEKGLFIGVDEFERFYLGLPPDEAARRQRRDASPRKMDTNPWFVLCAVTLADVRNYLEMHTGQHRFLTAAEVYGALAGIEQTLK